jgi:hypothetical protein
MALFQLEYLPNLKQPQSGLQFRLDKEGQAKRYLGQRHEVRGIIQQAGPTLTGDPFTLLLAVAYWVSSLPHSSSNLARYHRS